MPVLEVTDILKALNLFMVPQQLEMQAILPDNDDERVLLKLISHEPRHIDELIRESGLPTTTVSSTLTMMELKGMVKQVGGMQHVLTR
jgi:DNA processing protein